MDYTMVSHYFGLNMPKHIKKYIDNKNLVSPSQYVKLAFRYAYKDTLKKGFNGSMLIKCKACYISLMKMYGEDSRGSSTESIELMVER